MAPGIDSHPSAFRYVFVASAASPYRIASVSPHRNERNLRISIAWNLENISECDLKRLKIDKLDFSKS